MDGHQAGLAIVMSIVCLLAPLDTGVTSLTGSSSGAEKIAFHSNRDGSTQIYIMNADGSGLRRLTNNSASDVGPAISPDGARIAFVSNRDGNDHIYLMDIDGGNERRLTNAQEAEVEPAWSPDGTRICYRKEIGDRKTAICIVNADGGGFRQLTDGTIRYMAPTVSPDGKCILCASGPEIWILGIDGGDPRRIAKTTGILVAYPRWSPDGRKIVFGMVSGTPPNHKTDIFSMNADGTGEAALTKSQGINEYPCWSPDGTSIAFQTARDGNFEIYVMAADGGNPRRLTNLPAMDGRPSWGKAPAGSQKEASKD